MNSINIVSQYQRVVTKIRLEKSSKNDIKGHKFYTARLPLLLSVQFAKHVGVITQAHRLTWNLLRCKLIDIERTQQKKFCMN